MNPSTRRPFAATSACPRCGSASAAPFAAGGVCLRCAGARVFAMETGEPTSSEPASGDSAATVTEDRSGLPERIGAFEIIEELGRGGMARVFAARQIGLGRIVALKAIPTGRNTADLELRFLREAQTVARLRHPNIVGIHESGRSNGFAYFSMDYVEGGDLAHRLREGGFGPRTAAEFMRTVAGALAYTHGEGVLHRDLKPSNILLDAGEPRLADFGLAAQLEAGGDLTAVTGVLGTPHYVAPEALRGGSAALTVQSDLYALGVVLYEMLTGRTPYAGASPAELPAIIEAAEPPSVRLLAPAVPRDLETICLKCLEREPARRYASAAALAEDLRRFLAGEPIVARPASGLGRLIRWCRRRPTLAILWVLVTALAVGSTVAAVWIGRERNRAELALAQAQQSEVQAQANLRDARLSEARALRRTDSPGRRTQALAALTQAARIRPGDDLRDEAVAALILPDASPVETWNLNLNAPGEITFATGTDIVAVEYRDATGFQRSPATFWHWGAHEAFARIESPAAQVVGPLWFSRDGKLVMARYDDETLRVWRVGELKPFLTIPHRPLPGGLVHTEPFNADYDFSPDGKLLALGVPGGGVSLHRVADGAELGRWKGGQDFSLLRFSPDGKRLAAVRLSSYDERHVFVLRIPDCTLERSFELGTAPGLIAWSEDSRVVATAEIDNTIIGFDLRDGRELQKLPTAARDLWCLAFTGGDQYVLQRGTGTTIYLSSFARGEEELALPNVGAGMLSVVRGHDEFLSASIEGNATRWRMQEPKGFRVLPPPKVDGYQFGAGSGSLDFNADGTLVATAHARYTLVRNVATGRLLAEYDSGVTPGDDFRGVCFSPDGNSLLQTSPYAGVQRLPRQRGPEGWALGAPETLDAEKGFTLAAHSVDRRRMLLIDGNGGRVKVLQIGTTGVTTLSHWAVSGIYGGGFSGDGEAVLLNCSGLGPDAASQHLRVYRVRDGAVLHELTAPVSCDVAWSADGRTAMTSNGVDRSMLWNAATWQPIADLHGELGGNPTTFALSPNSQYAVVTRDDGIMLLSAQDGRRLAGWKSPGCSGLAVAVRFLPDGRRFAVLWRDGRIDVIDPEAIRQGLRPLGLAW